MEGIYKQIHDIGILPVIALDKAEDAAPLAKALCEGGLPVAEVTYRTAAAHETMLEMKKACPDMLIGAGTVTTKEQVDSALDAGAKFIVAPGLNPEIVKYCQSKNVPMIPGTSCASDIECAMSLGLDVVKFFPAEQLGGIKMIKALSAPYTKIKFVPTGGVKENNLNDYLNEDCVLACGGTWMIDKKAIAAGDFDKIKQLTRGAVMKMLGLHLKHVGVNAEIGKAEALADEFAKLFGGVVRAIPNAYFGSEYVEVVKGENPVGKYGHIGIGCNNPERTRRYYEACGYEFNEATKRLDSKGNLEFISFKNEIGGFSVHISYPIK